MKVHSLWLAVLICTVLLVVVGSAGAFSSAPSSAAVVEETITYQGRLTDAGGLPVHGQVTMRFVLYDDPIAGSAQWDSGNMSVQVVHGLFDVALQASQEVFAGEQLWLSIVVGGETLSPRQAIRPAPYAMSLRPGAVIEQAATGTAVRVTSVEGIGLHGAGQVYGLYGTNAGPTQGTGYGGYFQSTTGIGVYGESTGQTTLQNLYAPGVHGHSAQGVGVYGTSEATFGAGVFGQMATGTAVLGFSGGDGVVGSGRAHGVRGISTATTQGSGYGGYFSSGTGIGVYGQSTALLTTQNVFAPGVHGFSQNGAGVMGEAGSGAGSVGAYFRQGPGTGSWAGVFDGRVLIGGDLTVTGSKSGYVVDIARNDALEPLSQGDLVVVTGVTDPVVGNIPVPLVRKANTVASTAIIGVVDAIYHLDGDEHGAMGHMAVQTINSGDYVSIVTLGAFANIKVDASFGSIQPGDLLVSSPTPGHAMRAENPGIGTVLGKALEAHDEGTGVIAVMVTLQ